MKIFEIELFGFTLAPTYYWLMYILWFLYGIWALKKTKKYTKKQIDDLFLYIFLWVILGGRIWYMLFYNFEEMFTDPASLLRVWEWWMSFHGGMIGVILAMFLFARQKELSFLSLSDEIVKIIPLWIFFGRIGNYLNKELLWFPYTGPFAVHVSSGSYFPSPLVEAFLEGIVIFVILNFVLKSSKFPGQFWALFLILYWVFRTFVELFIRSPDPQIGYYFWFLTQGSLLSFPMILAGIIIYFYLQRNNVRK